MLRFLVLSLLLAGCSVPRLMVLNDPLDAEQHNDLGVAYQSRGDYELAQREFTRAADLEKEWALPLVNRGNVQAALGEWQKAAADYRRALKRDPAEAAAMNNLAWTLLQLGEQREGERWARQAVSLRPGEAAYWDTLAEAYLAGGDREAAQQAAGEGLRLAPPLPLRMQLEEKRNLPALPENHTR